MCKTYRAIGAMLIIAALLVAPWSSSAAPFAPGDLLITQFGNSMIQRYDAAGNLQQTITGSGTNWIGAALTPQGNIATARRTIAGINVFDRTGAQLVTFNTPAVNTTGDVSVFADGTFAVNSQLTSTVEFYSPTGVHLRSAAAANQPFGSAIAQDGTLWVSGVGGVGFGLKHLKEDGTALGSFATTFEPGDVVVDPETPRFG
jgi:sugar lactone lactonase YvrE